MISKLMALSLAFSMTGAFAQDKPLAAAYQVNSEATKVEWEGKKVAGPHSGTIKVKSGTVSVLGDEITSGTVVMDMNSVNVTDLEGEYKGKLEGHLKSPDFFDVNNHPEATLVIKSSKKTKKGLDVKGDLTIKGKTHPVSFIATDIKNTVDSFTAKAAFEVDRIKYGVEYNAGKGDKSLMKQLGDKLIYDKFTMKVDLTAKKQ